MKKKAFDIPAGPRPGNSWMMNRRDFIKFSFAASLILPQDLFRGQDRRRGYARNFDPSQIPPYVYRTLPIDRFLSLQEEWNQAVNGDRLGRNKTFRASIDALSFKLPDDFRGAKSVVVMATFAKTMYANFQLNGKTHRIMIPFQYYTDDMTPEHLKAVVLKDIVKQPGFKVADISNRVPLKLLAGRSGLGRYGRNNMIFVDKMGSYNLLSAFLTDFPFAEDTWSELTLLDACRHCRMCDRVCPTDCISRTNFVIDTGKCITLYNEIDGGFPNWILPSMHHALMGCMKCQARCPENDGVSGIAGNMEDVSEEETRQILQGTPDEELMKVLQRKLRQFPAPGAKEHPAVLKRNLSVLIRP